MKSPIAPNRPTWRAPSSSLLIVIAICMAIPSGAAQAAPRWNACGAPDLRYNNMFPGENGCFTFSTCRIGVRGDWLDWTDTVAVLTPPPQAAVSIERKGRGSSPIGCVPNGRNDEGYVVLSLSNISDVARAAGTMKLRLHHPNALAGPRSTDITFDVRNGTHVEKDVGNPNAPTFSARQNERTNLVLRGGNLTTLAAGSLVTGNPVIVSSDANTATVQVTFDQPGIINLGQKFRFTSDSASLNARYGWPTVMVSAPPPNPADTSITITFDAPAGLSPGSGTVISSPAGINCPGTCTHSFSEHSRVDLTATPDERSRFVAWRSAWLPMLTTRTNNIIVDRQPGGHHAVPLFARVTKLTVTKVGSAFGAVKSSAHASSLQTIDCGTACTTQTTDYTHPNASITLTQSPARNHIFEGWSISGPFQAGTCSSTSLTCTFTIGTTNRLVEARFR